ncbi:related to mitochondrial large ribosomal subunit [Ramularia collo-cygni]|uniref:Related to mitochondrial large ribosomal subunit n=1 Tax=Ramularia collo-cygni TaxID=112498 RepID=A0A2D3VJU0_9PEZI|nr:related to mitochondrial large ribosomal subunit [Ramularia collo-cygni]CZT22369.1 related to mitochondrial large ribosomal subunit [Ramularia collo-cygni]
MPISIPLRFRPQFQQRRAASDDAAKPSSANPVLDEWKRKNADAVSAEETVKPQLPQAGDIASSSIFEDERRIQQQQERETEEDAEGEDTKTGGISRDSYVMARVLDPKPAARQRFERRKVMQMVRKGGRLTKEEFIKRTEREHLVKSHNMKTSIKKLGMLARQIAGKPLDEAIIQMRFSKKKVAEEILAQLEAARDEAVVMRGMGLGSVAAEDAETLNDASASVTGTEHGALEPIKAANKERPVDIQLKDGKRHKVTDRTRIYIDEAWVGRGPYGKLPDYRARGRIYMMRTPWTSLSVVLKEEATRVREFEEREAKRKKAITQNVWKHLPDRPIQIQRQWYSW